MEESKRAKEQEAFKKLLEREQHILQEDQQTIQALWAQLGKEKIDLANYLKEINSQLSFDLRIEDDKTNDNNEK